MKPFNPEQFMIDAAANDLQPFMSRAQLAVMREACKGEESTWFITRLVEMAALINAMPKTYEQGLFGDQAIAHLHYFAGACDWYITERDADEDGEGQIQAFGSTNLGYGAELGYISIKEITECGAELDLHFTPCTLASLKQAVEAR